MNYDPLAELYDLQYRSYRDDLPFYTRLADDYGGPVLELGAGTARVAAALAAAERDACTDGTACWADTPGVRTSSKM